MKTSTIVIGLSLWLANVAVAATPVSADQQAAMDATQAVCEAIRASDMGTLERLLAPDFNLLSAGASVQTRADVLAEVRSGDPRYELFRNHSMVARVYGDTAVVQGITSLKGVQKAQAFTADVLFTDVLVRKQGTWQVVTSHATLVPAPAPQKGKSR